jgi:hypothetical protein
VKVEAKTAAKPKAKKKPTIGSVIRYNLVRDEKMTVEPVGGMLRESRPRRRQTRYPQARLPGHDERH